MSFLKHSREAALKKRNNDEQRQRLIEDVTKKAQIARTFLADPRHKDFIDLLSTAVAYKRGELEKVGNNSESNDDMIRRVVQLTSEIRTLLFIISTPEKLILNEEKITKKETDND